jgi:hypothetical protein
LRASRQEQIVMSGPKGRDYITGIGEQKRLELAYLSDYRACPPGIDASKVADRLASLKPSALQAETKGKFQNPEALAVAACISSSLILDRG